MADWEILKNANINTYENNFTDYILTIAKQCIPSRTVKINQDEPHWITSNIKRRFVNAKGCMKEQELRMIQLCGKKKLERLEMKL